MIIVWIALAVALLVFLVIVVAHVFGLIFHFLLTLFLLVLIAGVGFIVWQGIKIGRRVERVLSHLEGRARGEVGAGGLDDSDQLKSRRSLLGRKRSDES